MDDRTIPSVPMAELALPGEAHSAGVARRFLATTLAQWGDMGYGDDAALVLSELVSNAALHARTDMVVRVELRPDCLRVTVSDLSPQRPVVRRYSNASTTGRGLSLVDALARGWGIETHLDGSKTVWAEVAAGGSLAGSSTEDSDVELSAFGDLEDTGSASGSSFGVLRAA